jgi:pilus assembly protein CpaF
LVTSTLSEVVGLGLIDRPWFYRTVSAILINGPSSVFVDRDGTLQAVPEGFRDETHLELVSRLIARSASGMADLRLRDGSNGVVIFPPVAPTGPVLILRRAQPGEATLERLVASGLLDQPVADLLRLGGGAAASICWSPARRAWARRRCSLPWREILIPPCEL